MNYQDIKTFPYDRYPAHLLSKAAEVLFVSQPALSHRLSALEEELGTELIIRKKGSQHAGTYRCRAAFCPACAVSGKQLWLETSKIQLREAAGHSSDCKCRQSEFLFHAAGHRQFSGETQEMQLSY